MFDEIDNEIVRHLARDGRASHRELGKAVGLSPNAAGARMARLQKQGVITGFHAAIDHGAMGRPLEVTMDVWLDHRPSDAAFIELVAADDRIIYAIHITGPVDYRVQARVSSPEDLEDLLAKMRSDAGVNQTDTRLILSHLGTTTPDGRSAAL